VTASLDREALEALDALVARLGWIDLKRPSVSSVIRRAVVYMERATRDGAS
jgi:Arc/MetJ-type ribon-helix-helix transcriptional regulator